MKARRESLVAACKGAVKNGFAGEVASLLLLEAGVTASLDPSEASSIVQVSMSKALDAVLLLGAWCGDVQQKCPALTIS
jgi:hypothetical protein